MNNEKRIDPFVVRTDPFVITDQTSDQSTSDQSSSNPEINIDISQAAKTESQLYNPSISPTSNARSVATPVTAQPSQPTTVQTDSTPSYANPSVEITMQRSDQIPQTAVDTNSSSVATDAVQNTGTNPPAPIVYQTPIIKNQHIDSAKYDTLDTYIKCDYDKKEILLFKVVKQSNASVEHETSQNTSNLTNRSQRNTKSTQTKIADGCAELVGVVHRTKGSNTAVNFQIRILTRESTETIEIPADDIGMQEESVRKELIKHSVIFKNKSYFEEWCKYIAWQKKWFTPVCINEGFIIENGHWKNDKLSNSENSIFDTNLALSFFRDRVKPDADEQIFKELTLALYGFIGQAYFVFQTEGLGDIANLVLVNSDVNAVKKEIAMLYSTVPEHIFSVDKKTKKTLLSCEDDIPIVKIDGTSYMNNEIIKFISGSNDLQCLPILISKSCETMFASSSPNEFVVKLYNTGINNNTQKIINMLLSEVTNNPRFISDIKEKYVEYDRILSDNEDIELMDRPRCLIALLLSLTETVLSNLGVDKNNKLFDSYFNYLYSTSSSQSFNIQKLKDILSFDPEYHRRSRKDDSDAEDYCLYITEKEISMTGVTLDSIAAKFGYSSRKKFKELLDKSKLLSSKDMGVVNLQGTSNRMYSLSLEEIFPFGEYRPCCNLPNSGNIINSIPIGKDSNGKYVSFVLSEGRNNSVFISGSTDAGKTNLVNVLAEGGARQDMRVVIVGMNGSMKKLVKADKTVTYSETHPIIWEELDVSGMISKISILDENEDHLDTVLKEFFKYKTDRSSDSSVEHTLLIIDEAHNLNWNGDTPIKKILREGRQHGIVTILSTQYLNSDNASNIGSSLNQIGTFCSFKYGMLPPKLRKSSAKKVEDYLSNLYTGEMLISGNICVHGYPMNYPLKVWVDEFNPKNTEYR